MFGPISAKRLVMTKLFDRSFHRIDCRTWQRFSDVPDSASNQSLGGFRIGFAKFANPPRDLRKQIAGLKFEIVFVQISHALGSARLWRAGDRVFPIANFLLWILIAQRQQSLKESPLRRDAEINTRDTYITPN